MSDQHATTPRRRVPVTGLLGALLLLVAATASVGFAARSSDDPLAQLASTNPTKLPKIARDRKFMTACSYCP
jgi:hypothetical protein